MKATPSNQLADYLIEEGLVETTKEIYPDHFERATKDGYDPYKCKRRFETEDQRIIVVFDYINLKIYEDGHYQANENFTMEDIRQKISIHKLIN